MRVDVYPNITNVEVYENPISVPVEATWEKVTFQVADPVVNTFDLGRAIALDRDGDYVLQVHYNSVVAQYGTDFVIDGNVVRWVSSIALEAGEEISVWYSPKSQYGSVAGDGDVTSLTHLNDVTITGPLAGQMLMRDSNGKFVNRNLTAGDNVAIDSTGDGVTISAGLLNYTHNVSSVDIATDSDYINNKVAVSIGDCDVYLNPTESYSVGDTIRAIFIGTGIGANPQLNIYPRGSTLIYWNGSDIAEAALPAGGVDKVTISVGDRRAQEFKIVCIGTTPQKWLLIQPSN